MARAARNAAPKDMSESQFERVVSNAARFALVFIGFLVLLVALKEGRMVYDGPAGELTRDKLTDIYGPEFEDVFWEGAPQ